MDFNKQIRRYLSVVRRDLLKQIDKNNFVATQQMRERLRVVANQHFLDGEIRGVFYTKYLETGWRKKPTKVGREFVENIITWMQFKGIQPERRGQIMPMTEGNIKRSAFGIAQGIIDKGTPSTRQEKNLDIQKALADNMPGYLADVGQEFLITFSDKLKIKPKQ